MTTASKTSASVKTGTQIMKHKTIKPVKKGFVGSISADINNFVDQSSEYIQKMRKNTKEEK